MAWLKISSCSAQIGFEKSFYKYPFVWFGFNDTHYIDLFLKIFMFHTNNQIDNWYGAMEIYSL